MSVITYQKMQNDAIKEDLSTSKKTFEFEKIDHIEVYSFPQSHCKCNIDLQNVSFLSIYNNFDLQLFHFIKCLTLYS